MPPDRTTQKPVTAAPQLVTEGPARPAAPWGTWTVRLMILGIVLAALNLRPAITSLGALFEEVRTGLGMSGSIAGLLTAVPPLCFALFSPAVPWFSRRFGPATVVCAGMAAIAGGLLLRPFSDGTAGFLAASALALMGIAVTNVLMPVLVKRYFPDRVGSMTGLYSMALSLGTGLAAAATVPLTDALGGSWRLGLGLWATLAAVAVLPWLVVLRPLRAAERGPLTAEPGPPSVMRSGAGSTALAVTPADAAPAPARKAASLLRSPTAWALTGYFGLQGAGGYTVMGWIPQIFRDAGVSARTAGLLLAVIMALGVPLAFAIPRLAARLRNQGPIVAVLGLCGLGGYTGLYFAPAAGAWAWALLIGVANCAFPLALTMIGMRSRTATGVVRLSAFTQSVGYLIAVPVPLLVGVLYQHSGGWGLPICLMAGLLVPQIALGVLAGRDRTIEDETGMRD
ncbi:CynX/NimT family MFS transporter [Streptomyces sp. NPDC056500]|uniref:CynX/NimT family MFS transporter n=1 Tax=Streptomyces sp. NPDC056500 TaxID=3345840 RepID=UPI0036B279A8